MAALCSAVGEGVSGARSCVWGQSRNVTVNENSVYSLYGATASYRHPLLSLLESQVVDACPFKCLIQCYTGKNVNIQGGILQK